MDIAKNKEAVFERIAKAIQEAKRPQNSVEIIAVTKYVDSSTARELVNTGVSHIGENRVDKFLDKYHALKDLDVTWHLIGSLQRRKVKDVIHYVDYFHALDSLKLAQEIDKRAERTIKCFLQVNISKEETKHGFYEEELEDILPQLAQFSHLEIVGLMTMAPFEASHEQLEELFQKMKELQLNLQARAFSNMPFTELSMGMSRDYKEAITQGSTFVRIGTAFFK